MELTGDILIAAPRDKVWAALNDPAALMRCLPGCEHIEVLSPTEKQVRVLVRVGPVRARFVGKIRMDQVRAGQGCVLHFEGSGGAAGMAKGESSVELADEGSGTRLRYTARASVGGKLGQIGGRMMDAAAKQLADQFFAALERELGTAAAPAMLPVVVGKPEVPATVAAEQGAPAAGPGLQGEWLRVLWFALGALATGFGVWLGARL